MTNRRVLIECDDEKGLVYKVSTIFYELNLNILSNSEFVDSENGRFFMRSVVTTESSDLELKDRLRALLPKEAQIKIVTDERKKIVLFATKESHALGDILIRYDSGELDADILAVISNHSTLESLTSRFDIPFFHISADGISRKEHESRVLKCLRDFEQIDYIVLAKYMRILTPEFVTLYENRIINIHHSFLPAFIGANPYKQAYDRGVKIIGATAHFVNNDLDEGPIIAQGVSHVDHAYDWHGMQRLGRDTEKIVLSQALKLALEDRIFVYKNRSVIF